MVDKLLKSLRVEKDAYLNAKEGSEFEERVMYFLKTTLGLSRIRRDQIDAKDWIAVKNHIADKLGTEFMDTPNPLLKNTFIYQPYGSQNFPDFIIFTEKKVVPIEVKFSTQSQTRPVWNGHVPRAAAFYVFGSYGLKDITFFQGNDVLASRHREELYRFFNEIREVQTKIRLTMPALDETDRGFTPYIRAAFTQAKHKDTVHMNFFTHPKRIEVEDQAIEEALTL